MAKLRFLSIYSQVNDPTPLPVMVADRRHSCRMLPGLVMPLIVFLFSLSTGVCQTQSSPTLGLLVGVAGLGDQSYNDMTYAGLVKIKQERNLKLIFEDSEKTEAASRASMQRLVDKGASIIVANGFYFKELVEEFALLYSDRYFILQDAALPHLSNVVGIHYSVHEGSFLAGALAGMMTTTGKVGFIGGVDIPIMHVFRQGFVEGVFYTNPTASVQQEFVTKAPDFSGFSQPDTGYDMGMEAYDSGIDIIYAAAGLTGNGVLQAARKSGKFAIGVDSDQDHLAKGAVLTSMMKRLDYTTYSEITKILDGNFQPGIMQYGLKEKGVGLSPMKFTRHLIPATVLKRLSIIESLIIDGTIKLTSYLEAEGTESEKVSQ